MYCLSLCIVFVNSKKQEQRSVTLEMVKSSVFSKKFLFLLPKHFYSRDNVKTKQSYI